MQLKGSAFGIVFSTSACSERHCPPGRGRAGGWRLAGGVRGAWVVLRVTEGGLSEGVGVSRTPSWLLREVPSGYNSEMSENTGRDLVLRVIFVKLVIF